MRTEMQESLRLFVANAAAMHKAFPWHNDGANRLAALAYTRAEKEINAEAVRRCLDTIKESTGAFSNFRGDMQAFLAAMKRASWGSTGPKGKRTTRILSFF
jgi:hypothetical protein